MENVNKIEFTKINEVTMDHLKKMMDREFFYIDYGLGFDKDPFSTRTVFRIKMIEAHDGYEFCYKRLRLGIEDYGIDYPPVADSMEKLIELINEVITKFNEPHPNPYAAKKIAEFRRHPDGTPFEYFLYTSNQELARYL